MFAISGGPFRVLLALVMAFVLFAPGSLAAPAPQEIVLDNGMHVLLLPHRGSGMVASNVFVGAGSTREEDPYAGSSHFLEHVLFNGTSRRTQEEIYAAADRIGAYNNATTRQEYTLYMMVAPSERLAEALDLQSDMLLHSTLPEDKFEKERGIVIEELSKDKDSPEYLQERALDELRFGSGSDYGRPVLGSVETITNLPRPNVVAYYRRQYAPSNMRLVLMGEFEPTRALELIQRLFAAQENPSDSAPRKAPACLPTSPGQLSTRPVDAKQTITELLLTLPAGSPEDDAALALLARIAGGTRSSRLARALDADPPVPNDESSASLQFVQEGRMMRLQTRSSEGSAQEVTRRLLASLHSLTAITTAELEAARTALLAEEISQIEQLHYYALFQGDRLWHMGPEYTARYVAALETADAKTLSAMAARLLSEARLQAVAAGPGLESGQVPLASLAPDSERVRALQQGTGEFHPAQRHRPAALEADEPPTVVQLENGLTLVHVAAPSTRMFALHLLVKNRSLREPRDHTGIADLLHRTLASRIETPGEPSPLENIGATLKVADNPWIPYDDYYTTPLYSFVRLECVDEYHRSALELLARILRGPHGDAKALESARQEMLMALERRASSPGATAEKRMAERLFPEHPLSRSVMGSASSLEDITEKTLQEFARPYLSPDQLVLACVGNVSKTEALEQIQATLGKLEGAPSQSLTLPPPPVTGESAREEIDGGGNQSALRLGRVVEIDPADRWALLVATRIASGKMQQDLRETRGLAYSLGISVEFLGGVACLEASMGTRPQNLEEAEAGMRTYFAGGSLQSTAEEIETAVNKHLSRMRMRRITSMGQAFTLSRDLFLDGDLEEAQKEARGLAAVTPDDVARVAQRYFGDGPTITIVVR